MNPFEMPDELLLHVNDELGVRDPLSRASSYMALQNYLSPSCWSFKCSSSSSGISHRFNKSFWASSECFGHILINKKKRKKKAFDPQRFLMG
jgi:hypothetical protein